MATLWETEQKLINAILKIPTMAQFDVRTTLLNGLGNPPITRIAANDRADITSMVQGLEQLGRLNDDAGTRPLIALAQNAKNYVQAGSAVSNELEQVILDLQAYYGGEQQPAPAPLPPGEPEFLIFGRQRDTRLSYYFIAKASAVARSVAKLTVPVVKDGQSNGLVAYGTGWIIAPGVMITNYHVIEARDRAHGEPPAAPADVQTQVQQIHVGFDYFSESEGAQPGLVCNGAQLLASSSGGPLDYALISLAEPAKIQDRPPLSIVKEQPQLVRSSRVNIAQHGGGGPLKFAIRNNFYVRIGSDPFRLLYQTDTEPAASGSPVCNDDWQVVGLHRAADTVPPVQVPQEVVDGQPVAVTVLNEAISIHAILDNLSQPLKKQIWDAQPA